MINGHIDKPRRSEKIKEAMGCMGGEICAECEFEECRAQDIPTSVVALINHLITENEALISGQETLQKHLAEKNAEIERLKRERDFYKAPSSELARGVEQIRNKAIKEFAEKIYRFFCKKSNWNNLKSAVCFNGECDWLKENLDNLVKEMDDKSFWEDTH